MSPSKVAILGWYGFCDLIALSNAYGCIALGAPIRNPSDVAQRR